MRPSAKLMLCLVLVTVGTLERVIPCFAVGEERDIQSIHELVGDPLTEAPDPGALQLGLPAGPEIDLASTRHRGFAGSFGRFKRQLDGGLFNEEDDYGFGEEPGGGRPVGGKLPSRKPGKPTEEEEDEQFLDMLFKQLGNMLTKIAGGVVQQIINSIMGGGGGGGGGGGMPGIGGGMGGGMLDGILGMGGGMGGMGGIGNLLGLFGRSSYESRRNPSIGIAHKPDYLTKKFIQVWLRLVLTCEINPELDTCRPGLSPSSGSLMRQGRLRRERLRSKFEGVLGDMLEKEFRSSRSPYFTHWLKRKRRAADLQDLNFAETKDSIVEDKKKPYFSPKIMDGSPYEKKDQASFATSTHKRPDFLNIVKGKPGLRKVSA